ncbi:AAA-domain-containing protein [Apiospora arundinis]|uniref:AAA-domain-containing protein n=1 Tax=Apiospora arundinis TaxID=335852 RepID=A0ABR2J4S2_9PEZI
MVSKRKRDNNLFFDVNKSDSEDENFEPGQDQPTARSRKKPRSHAKPSRRAGRTRKNRYHGSDVEDDDEVSESDQDVSFGEDNDEDEDEDDELLNETGRRKRKAAIGKPNYKESSEDDSVAADSDGKDELVGETPKKRTPRQSKIVILKVPPSDRKPTQIKITGPPTRRTTRAHTADVEAEGEFIELSNSGKHALPAARGSREPSEGPATRSGRATRGTKSVANPAIPPIEEATQESSSHQNGSHEPAAVAADEEDAEHDEPEAEIKEDDEDAEGVDEDEAPQADEDHPMETVEPVGADDDEDDQPITRRTRGRRGNRLTRGSRKSAQEPSSDFEPDGNESADENLSNSDKDQKDDEKEDESSSSNARGRRGAKGRGRAAKRSRQPEDSGEGEDEIDQEELADELMELREGGRRRSPAIAYEAAKSRRKSRGRRVNYAIKPLDQVIIEPEEEEEQAAPTTGRKRRAGGGAGWIHSLHTMAGPFGGVEASGPGALFSGPWGTGAAGGVDSDSSDDEMGTRAGLAGNVGMTPTSAAPLVLAGGTKNPGLDGLGGAGAAAPNVGKVKDQKAYADADPLGVDMTVDFSKVGGLQGHIEQLKEMVQLPLLYPDLYLHLHVTPPRGVLFHGPPGTGKTLVARALANSVGFGGKKITFYMRKGADALSKWVGEAEKQLRLLFEEARRTQPSIIFFDEIDGLAPVRSSKQEQIHASIVSTLLALMDGMDGRGQVIVIGATNRPDNIDPALRRPGRFDREFYFPLPDVDGRRSIIDIHTQDWGLPDDFKQALARDAKGYGGADLRALCTEAALNAIQRTYPQIYYSNEKLLVDAKQVKVNMTDFRLSKKKIVPSSERSSTSGAKPLPEAIKPLLQNQLNTIKSVLDNVLPRQKKVTALEEAMFEAYEDEDYGFGREALNDEFERSKVFRPRLLVSGSPGMGQPYLGAALLHDLEGVHVQNFDLGTILGDQRPAEQVIVALFTEVRRHKPSVIYIPNVDTWYHAMEGPPITVFLAMLRSIQPTEPILVLGTADCELESLDPHLKRDLFGFSKGNCIEIARPSQSKRLEYFSLMLSHLRRFPKDFPDPMNRKKRILEKLPLAPPPPPKVLSKEEEKAEWLQYRRVLNLMKVHLQPIMEQINRKYRKFRAPVINPQLYSYLFDEMDPNYVRPDVEDAVPRPFIAAKDKEGRDGIREVATGKFYYNMDIQTIEERLANGYYHKPQKFLEDVITLEKDAKASGDRERILKASELVTNVEVDVNDVASKLASIEWDRLYETERQRRAAKEEKQRKKMAMKSAIDMVNSSVAGSADSNGGLHTTTAQFQVMSPLHNGHGNSSSSQHALSNGTTVPSRTTGEDVQMEDATDSMDTTTSPVQQWPDMQQRPLNLSTRATTGGTAQISQISAVQSLPPGVSPSALVNDASTTKTTDPSNRSSNWSTQVTNGVPREPPSSPIPDTQDFLVPQMSASQATSSDEPWPHSQAHGLARGIIHAPGASTDSRSQASPEKAKSSHAPSSMANLLNDPVPDEESQSQRQSGGSAAAAQELDENSAQFFLEELTKRTSGCTIEQLEQLTREMMAEIWSTRGEHNRMRVLHSVTRVFNDAINDIEQTQKVQKSSQDTMSHETYQKSHSGYM